MLISAAETYNHVNAKLRMDREIWFGTAKAILI